MPALLAVILAGGCSGDGWGDGGNDCAPPPPPSIPESSGSLRLGTFRWDCVSSSDAVCDRGAFPAAVAVGGRFDLDFEASERLPEEIVPSGVEPVSGLVTSGSGALTAEREGEITLVVMSSHGAVDFIDLSLREVSDLQLTLLRERETSAEDEDEGRCPSASSPESVTEDRAELVVGELATLRATPYGDGADLGGSLSYEWESKTPDVVRVIEQRGREARFEGLTVGTAILEIEVAGHQQLLEVEVVPEPMAEDEGEGPRRTRPDDGPRRTRPDDEEGTDTGPDEESGSEESGESGSEESGESGSEESGESGAGTSGGME